jgi:hypothetical protein
LGIIIPTDFHIFQRGGSTTNQNMVMKTGIKSSFEVNELDGTMDVLLPPISWPRFTTLPGQSTWWIMED